MTSAGELQPGFRFLRRAADANGDRTGDFELVFTTSAKRQFLRGGEAVQAQRLTGEQPVVFRLRRCEAALAVATDWRIRDRLGVVYEVVSTEPTEDRAWIDVLTKLNRAEQADDAEPR